MSCEGLKFHDLDQGGLPEEHTVDMISLSFIVELVVLFSGFPGIAVLV
jgi:hypothetical protein